MSSETTTTGYFGRIKNAVVGVLFGLILFVGSFVLHWKNEHHAVKDYETIGELAAQASKVDAGSVSGENDGQPIVVTATALTENPINDPVFGVSEVALRLKRSAEMYQWDEKKDTDTSKTAGGGTTTTTTYSYHKRWSERHINSNSFHDNGYDNPPSMEYKSQVWNAPDISLGAFQLADFLTEQLTRFESISPGSEPPSIPGIQSTGAGYYIGSNPSSPQIGDYRIGFSAVKPQEVTVLAVQQGNQFQPYQSEKTGLQKSLLMPGDLTVVEMVDELMRRAVLRTWLMRGLGFILMGFGLVLITKPLAVLADVLPFVGNLVGSGLGFASFLIAAILSLITIAVAWVAARPVIAISIFVVVAGLIVLLVMVTRKKKDSAAIPPPAPQQMPPPPPVSG